ncbi:MAG: phosphopyruvate hydratase [bacterium]|nr:phosphopyruvate hydratase [Candidatus Microgenomates bacterium CPR3]MCQ3944397.1 phosphopyruvate hydratase [bacterium]RIK50697.1 MAG: phosphopyruvate hydratase [Candidatus Microgenomates bacterium]
MKITKISAYEILASGGYPTIEAYVELEDGSSATASVPYGASAGSHEATVMVDEDSTRWNGKGMQKAISNINTVLSPALLGHDAYDQRAIDQLMIDLDGTPNKAKLGGNAILALSLAVANAAASSKKVELYHHIIDTFQTGVDLKTLPQPMVVVIEGGKHADETTDLQEFCFSASRKASVAENVRMIMECYHALAKVLKKNKLSTNVGNEGAFAPSGIPTNEAPFTYMLEAIQLAGYKPKDEVGLSVDAAASEFYKDSNYELAIEKRTLSADELISYYESWLQKYPIVSIEDMLHEDDWDNWTKLKVVTDKYGIPLIGDDLTVTNPVRLQKAIDQNAISAILIKLNQIGTLTETVDCCLLARKHGLMTITSHRGGGETNDATMVDVAVAVGSAFIKVGPTRGERVSKYNRLMAIERGLHA